MLLKEGLRSPMILNIRCHWYRLSI